MSMPTGPSILVADDDPQFLKIMEHHIRGWSYRVQVASDKEQLLRLLAGGAPDLLLMDVRFGEHDGIEVLRQVLAEHPALKVAMLTAFGSIDNAIAAIKLGAIDYLTKPVDLNRLRQVLGLSEGLASAPGPAAAPVPGSVPPPLTRPILGSSRAVADLRAVIARVAESEATVLVLGESGTGKELVARAVHEWGPRRAGPFVPLNVAAMPRELVESTLFGHAKGAFTGADRSQSGCCEVADGGTLFLDEIGEMEIGLQAKLLRFLQDRSFRRVGQSRPIAVDVRIVAATNRDPLDQVRRGQLREDLYYRLNVFPIVVPPLRARAGDVPLLARHFLDRFSARGDRPPLAFAEPAIDELMRHDWPGNVRELENLVERLAILASGPVITAEQVRAERPGPPAPGRPLEAGAGLRAIDRIEMDAILEALSASDGNVREAARRLGLGQATVYRKIKKYKIG